MTWRCRMLLRKPCGQSPPSFRSSLQVVCVCVRVCVRVRAHAWYVRMRVRVCALVCVCVCVCVQRRACLGCHPTFIVAPLSSN
jgi:hypothetical protein